MIGSGMIAVSTGRQHGHGGRHRRHHPLVASVGAMQRRALRSLDAAGDRRLPRIAAIAAMIAVVVVIIAPVAAIARGRAALGGLVRTAAFLVIRGKVFVILHPRDDFFTVRQRLGTAALTAIGIGGRRSPADVDAGDAGIDARAAGIRRVDGQARLGSAAHHVDVVSGRRRAGLSAVRRHASRRRIQHLKRLIAALIEISEKKF